MSSIDALPEQTPLHWPRRAYAVRAMSAGDGLTPLPAATLCRLQYGAPVGGDSDAGEDSIDKADPRCVHLPLQPMSGVRHGERVGELWVSTDAPVRCGWSGRFGYAENGDVAFVHLHLPEAALASLETAINSAYSELAQLIGTLGFPHLLRVWNYLGEINLGEGDAERYRQFCVGRFAAMSGQRSFEAQLPAASAIGSRSGGFTLIAIAGRQPGVQVENPRQVSAFRYPRAYGVRSPSFSRATLLPWADGAELLVSGTASIVGHATAHAGDPLAQLQQTAANLDALRTHALQTRRAVCGSDRAAVRALQPYFYTLYLRHAEDLPLLLPEIERLFGQAPLQVLLGDVCRRELLLEVEAIYRDIFDETEVSSAPQGDAVPEPAC